MKMFKIAVPYTVTVTGEFTHTITEEDVLDYFEVDSLTDIDSEDLEEFLKTQAVDEAYNIDTELLVDDLRQDRGFEVDEYQVEILVD